MTRRQHDTAKLIAMIEAKYQARGCSESFNLVQRELFSDILANLPFALAVTAVKRILLFSSAFVPDPAELLLTAARLASPLPDEDTAWAEVFDDMGRYRPKPASHGQIAETVRSLGGYDTLWHQYRFNGTPLGVLRSQFLEAYRRRRDRWELAVRDLLLKPACNWDWALLPPDNALLIEVDHERVSWCRHIAEQREAEARRRLPPPAPPESEIDHEASLVAKREAFERMYRATAPVGTRSSDRSDPSDHSATVPANVDALRHLMRGNNS